jgi:CheY-like chemotaxis protein
MKKLLFVDDQWCEPEERCTIIASFGQLQRGENAYEFLYETAQIFSAGDKKKYGMPSVMAVLSKNPGIVAVICDMNFGSQEKFGLEITREIKKVYPHLPVILMSSLSREEVRDEATQAGADDFLVKKPGLEEMQEALKRVRK